MALPQNIVNQLNEIKEWCEKGRKEYTGGPKHFHHLGNLREAALPHKTDREIGHRVRMLMRDDFDHEGIVCAARDRIFHLSERLAAYDAAAREVARYHDAADPIPGKVWQALYDAMGGAVKNTEKESHDPH